VKCQTRVKGPTGISFIDDRSPLPDNIVENYDNLAYDLTAVYQVKTYDQLQEILDYNLPGIVDMVPDADLTVEPSLGGAAPVSKLAGTPAATPTVNKLTNRVTTRINDADDNVASKNVAAAQLDEDFAAEAERILNG
jgi:hypothetical protein